MYVYIYIYIYIVVDANLSGDPESDRGALAFCKAPPLKTTTS